LNRALTLAVARFPEPAHVRDTFHGGTSEQVERCQNDRESNMRVSTAYFAGAGTVIAAIVAGVGGGLVIADMISPKSPKQGTELSRLERRMSSEPIQAAAGPSEPVQYLAAPQPSAAVAPVTAAPAQAQAQAEGNSGSPRAQPAIAQPAGAAPLTVSDTQAAAPAARPAAREQTAAPEDALAKARDAEVKRADAEAKRAMEKRRAERRQQSADKRRQRQQQEPRAVEQNIREDTEPRQFAAEPVRMQTPQFRLLGSE
jgi:flagellar biosynthesis GTPase FlhF